MELISVDKPYNWMKAKLGDVVYARRGVGEAPVPPQEVVYVGKGAFVVESPEGELTVYEKDTTGMGIFTEERMLVVNEFAVPAPLEQDPGEGQVVYVADPTLSEWHSTLIHIPMSMALRTLVIARGLAHATADAATAHAKAMAGVDPYAAPGSLDRLRQPALAAPYPKPSSCLRGSPTLIGNSCPGASSTKKQLTPGPLWEILIPRRSIRQGFTKPR